MTKKIIDTGSDFSGVGSFDQAFERLGLEQNKIFACDMDANARKTYILNYGLPNYYPENVFDRKIPDHPLDVYMTSPPCQSFSMAGKRGGEDDDRGVLFYNSHEFIQKNKPRYFIFENVRGLVSHDKGKKEDPMGRTFRKWLDYLGGKSVNGNPVIFPHPDAVDYHIYWKVLNAKNHGIPQNRERVFIVGIRDDVDNDFSFPKKTPLIKKLKDCLEKNVDKKYYLSEKVLKGYINHGNRHKDKGNGFAFEMVDLDGYSKAITTASGSRNTDNYIYVNSNNAKGYEVAEPGDSINMKNPNSKTRRGRVGKEIACTILTGEQQCVYQEPNGELNLDVNKNKSLYEYLLKTQVRKLTPRECFRLMDFPDNFKIEVNDTQSYRQAGNSIPVGLLVKIIDRLKL